MGCEYFKTLAINSFSILKYIEKLKALLFNIPTCSRADFLGSTLALELHADYLFSCCIANAQRTRK